MEENLRAPELMRRDRCKFSAPSDLKASSLEAERGDSSPGDFFFARGGFLFDSSRNGKPHLILVTPEFKVTDGTRTELKANSLSGRC